MVHSVPQSRHAYESLVGVESVRRARAAIPIALRGAAPCLQLRGSSWPARWGVVKEAVRSRRVVTILTRSAGVLTATIGAHAGWRRREELMTTPGHDVVANTLRFPLT